MVSFAESCTYNDLNRDIVVKKPKTVEGAIQDQLANKFSYLLHDALQDTEVRQFLKEEVSKKIDKDFDILYAAVRNKTITIKANDGSARSTTFENILLKSVNASAGRAASSNSFIDSIFTYFPLLQIAIPETNKNSPLNWNASTTVPFVTIVESDNDEATTKTLPAITPSGNRIQIDAKTIPNELYAVISKSERIGVRKKDQTKTIRTQTSGECILFEDQNNIYYSLVADCGYSGGDTGNGTSLACREFGANEFLTEINIPNLSDIESWFKGAPEIFLQIKTQDGAGVFSMGRDRYIGPDSRSDIYEDHWWNCTDIDVYQWTVNGTTDRTIFFWSEIDGGEPVTVEINYTDAKTGLAVKVGFQIGNGDDEAGYRLIQLTECSKQFSTGTLNWRANYSK